jgi:CubicO group peptidase (beta-lactamase class C family)
MQNETQPAPVEGTVQPGYEAVRTAFAENLASGKELGAHFAVYRHGEAIVDLWGGRMARDPALPIERGSLYTIFSATKALVAMCFALLVERGKISYDEPVATYWPEFASHGKGEVTVGELLSHQAGLPTTRIPATIEDYYAHDGVAAALAGQEPYFRPGVWSYHPVSFAALTDELMRRTDGRTLRQFYHEELAARAAGDMLLGLPEAEDARHVGMEQSPAPGTVIFDSPRPEMLERAMSNPKSDLNWANQRRFRAEGLPHAGASGNARGLAKLYATLLTDHAPLLSPAVFEQATRERIAGIDQGSGGIGRYAAGFRLNVGNMGANPAAFGHPGLGGTMGFADPARGLGVAYTTNRPFNASLEQADPRFLNLLLAFYAAEAAHALVVA